jgi:hypothetical protein
LQLLEATPEELAAIGGYLAGRPFPDRQPVAPGAPTRQAVQGSGRRRFALRKGDGTWELTYEYEPGSFRRSAGTEFIDYFLKHPRQPIHPVVLLAKMQGLDPVQQRSAALDDADATTEYLEEMERLRGVIANDKKSAAEKKVAAEELAQLEQCESYIYHRTFDKASRAAKSVRQAIRRVIGSLEKARDEQGRPHRVLNAFAAHLKQYLLGPSQPGSASAGHLVYEPPPGVLWE